MTAHVAEVTRRGGIDMQVCVPKDWTDEQIREFAESENPCGTQHGWEIRTDEELLRGSPIRNPCQQRTDFVHVTLDA